MDFFQHQDQARRYSRWLIVLFILGVISLLIITNAFLILFPWQMNSTAFSENGANSSLVCLLESGCAFWQSVNWVQVFWVSTLVCLVIAAVSGLKWLSLKAGGRKVAAIMGGKPIDPSRGDLSLGEKRLQNVVEEMAIAASMPVPEVFVLADESAINAFAAGFSSQDAIVAVTEGALKHLSREQLQAVVAHEFSHILNGDMRLNMHLIAVLHGIVFISEAGAVLWRHSVYQHKRRSGLPTAVLGLGLFVIGYLGSVMAQAIKASLNRQREFLADASSVQFTRNPEGMSGALKAIDYHGRQAVLQNKRSIEVSHLFFAKALTKSQSLFASHPPLKARIKRIEPYWDGSFTPATPWQEKFQKAGNTDEPAPQDLENKSIAMLLALLPACFKQKGENPLHQGLFAAASVLQLLFAKEPETQDKQMLLCQKIWPQLHQGLLDKHFLSVGREQALMLVELSVVGLRSLPEADYKKLQRCVLAWVQADDHIDLFEWCLYQLLKAHLNPHYYPAKRPKPRYLRASQLKPELLCLFNSCLSYTEQTNPEKQQSLNAAWQALGFQHEAVFSYTVDVKALSAATDKLLHAYPLLKKRIFDALVLACKDDGKLECAEQDVIRCFAILLACPIPQDMWALID